MRFIDEVKISVASGRGGPGKVSFRRESFYPRGGPDGGDGGKGGDVYFRVSSHLNTLVDFRPNKKYQAQSGAPGGASDMTGRDGEDLILNVPRGTLVKSLTGEVLVDLTDINEFCLLKGGRGGKGNAFFKTSVNQAPERAQPGEPHQEMEIILELKLIADVGIIGFPNAGKSTLISRISQARPKIADYPFTTLTPQLGVVKVGDYDSFVVADIPGLIEGASQGLGLGFEFLKHIERTSLFIHLVDASAVLQGKSCLQDYLQILTELKNYDELQSGKEDYVPLSQREQLVVLSKIDLISEKQLQSLEAEFKKLIHYTPYSISAVTGKGIEELVRTLSKKIQNKVSE